MPQANGLRANLICNGIPLAEYPVPSAPPNTVFCESTPGQTFEVNFSGPMAPFDHVIYLYCDGVLMDSCAISRYTPLSKTFHGIYLQNDFTKLMPFKFSKIELCEEDDSHPEQIVKNLGTISLELYRCTFGHLLTSHQTYIPLVASKDKFSERNKKASMIPHTVGLGESTTAPIPRSTTVAHLLQRDPIPYQRFIWQYRSRNMLITAGIIPRPVIPLPDIRPSTSSSSPRQNNNSLAPSYHETAGMTPGPSSNKTHREPKPDIKPKTSAGKSVVIDLCDDDDRPIVKPIVIHSSLENPILLDDDDDDEPALQRSRKAIRASSSSHQVDTKPAKIELKTEKITAPDGQPNQTKRAQAETRFEERDQKRVKVEGHSIL